MMVWWSLKIICFLRIRLVLLCGLVCCIEVGSVIGLRSGRQGLIGCVVLVGAGSWAPVSGDWFGMLRFILFGMSVIFVLMVGVLIVWGLSLRFLRLLFFYHCRSWRRDVSSRGVSVPPWNWFSWGSLRFFFYTFSFIGLWVVISWFFFLCHNLGM